MMLGLFWRRIIGNLPYDDRYLGGGVPVRIRIRWVRGEPWLLWSPCSRSEPTVGDEVHCTSHVSPFVHETKRHLANRVQHS